MDREGVVDRYLRYLPNLLNYSTTTARCHKSVLRLWFTFLDTQKIDFLNAESEHVLSWIDYRQNEQHVKDCTITKNLCVLRTFYHHLWEQQMLTRISPVHYLPHFICKPSEEGDYMSIDECFSLLESIDAGTPVGLRNYTAIALMWSTGLRSKELVSLKWNDIDFEDSHFIVRKGKGNKQRQIYLASRIKNDLLFYKQSLNDSSPHNFVFEAEETFNPQQKKKRHLSTNRLCDIIRTCAKKSGIKRVVGARTLRHSFATHMYEASISVKDLKEIMGHDEETETTIYIHVTVEAAKHILARHASQTYEKGEE